MLNDKNRSFLGWHIYQVYPRSFYDSNGDGIGDLQGVIAKLDYLKELGINAIWLSPCFKSPNEDNGYDVADYRDIMDEFGTMEDMRQLIREMHSRDMKLILDLVPNHTSSQHRWFQESRKSRDNPYSDYYYWFDTPPNDWQSVFGGSAYAFDEQRQQYYLHSYALGQPDLNWENPKVVREIQDIVDFWTEQGADGFRIDVIDQISKDFPGNRNCFGPRLHEYIHAIFSRKNVDHLFTVGECWADELEEIRRHVGQDRGELSTLFQFDHLNFGRGDKFTPKPGNLTQLWAYLRHWCLTMQEEDLLFSLFTDNHDNGWLLERLGSREQRYESACCIAAMVYLMRGVCFIYQGQELGMMNPHYDSITDFRDVESLNLYPQLSTEFGEEEAMHKLNFGSRDNQRRPFSWSGDADAGFASCEPWTPLHSDHLTVNAETDMAAEKSVWRFYSALLHLRSAEDALTVGEFVPVAPEDASYCAFKRVEEDSTILVVCNFEKPQTLHIDGATGPVLLSNYGHNEKHDGCYQPYEVAVFRA